LKGVLLAVRWSHNRVLQNINEPSDELVYRINPDGDVLYKLALPRRDGPLHDDMVLGEHDLAFATSGGVLVAFNVRSGRELWRWDSNTPEVSVYTATADGGCVIRTPQGMVLVQNEASARQLMEGNATVNWQGQWYRARQ
jgi:outer membrane protein assembly factor BamB